MGDEPRRLAAGAVVEVRALIGSLDIAEFKRLLGRIADAFEEHVELVKSQGERLRQIDERSLAMEQKQLERQAAEDFRKSKERGDAVN